MVLGRVFFSLVGCWMMVVKQMLVLNPLYLFKVAFLWFFLAFAVTYLFFLLCHVKNMVNVRQDLAVELSKSLWFGFLTSTVFLALYECILTMLAKSEFFAIHRYMIVSMSVISRCDKAFYKTFSFMIVFMSAYFAYNSISSLLETWCKKAVCDRYALCIMMTSLICWGFLWFLAYV
ncbi:MAG: hypothetical protein NTZ68_03440 [Candidatus Dependentiae bacterium]|nr:hypothetical protein [Candidatus Dependentiae bacterium]